MRAFEVADSGVSDLVPEVAGVLLTALYESVVAAAAESGPPKEIHLFFLREGAPTTSTPMVLGGEWFGFNEWTRRLREGLQRACQLARHEQRKKHHPHHPQHDTIRVQLMYAADLGEVVFNLGPREGPLPDGRLGRVLLSPYVLDQMISQAGFPVAHIYMNVLDYVDVRKFGRDRIDIETQPVFLRQGIQAYLLDAPQTSIRTRSDVPSGVVVLASPEAAQAIPQPGPTGSLNPLWFSPTLADLPLWTTQSTKPSRDHRGELSVEPYRPTVYERLLSDDVV